MSMRLFCTLVLEKNQPLVSNNRLNSSLEKEKTSCIFINLILKLVGIIVFEGVSLSKPILWVRALLASTQLILLPLTCGIRGSHGYNDHCLHVWVSFWYQQVKLVGGLNYLRQSQLSKMLSKERLSFTLLMFVESVPQVATPPFRIPQMWVWSRETTWLSCLKNYRFGVN